MDPKKHRLKGTKATGKNQVVSIAMSIEFPETYILAEQLKKELPGRSIASFKLKDVEKFLKDGVVGPAKEFNQLLSRTIQDVIAKGMTIIIKLDNRLNLLLNGEYSGKILYHNQAELVPKKYHLYLTFTDDTYLTVWIGFGYIRALSDDQLESVYIYRRDFGVPSPLDAAFSVDLFIKSLIGQERMLRPFLVGKNAIVGGLGNYSWQEIMHQAKIPPRVRASDLTEKELRRLYKSIQNVVRTRIRQGGKTKFIDLYGKPGKAEPRLGSFILEKPCPVCGTAIERISLGGGTTYYCPGCQR